MGMRPWHLRHAGEGAAIQSRRSGLGRWDLSKSLAEETGLR
jgi:hypothetical protein